MKISRTELLAWSVSNGTPWQFPIPNKLLPLFILSCLLLTYSSYAEDEKHNAKSQSGKRYADVLSELQKEAAETDLGKMDKFRALQSKVGKETAELSRETRKLERDLEALNGKRERTRNHLERFSDLAPGTVEKAEVHYLKKTAEQEDLKSKLQALRNKSDNSTEEEISDMEDRIEAVRKEKNKTSKKLSEWWRKMDEAQKEANESTLKPGPLNLVDTAVVPDEDLIGLNDYLEEKDTLTQSLEEEKEILEKMRKLKADILAKAKEEKEKKDKAAQNSDPANSGQTSKLQRPDPAKNLDWLSTHLASSKEQNFEPAKELLKLSEMATGIRKRLDELAAWIDPFIFKRSMDPSTEYLMPDATDEIREQWKSWAALSANDLNEWVARNKRIAARNEKVLAQAISENETRLAVYRDKEGKSWEELTPETAERLKSEFIQFVMRMVGIRQHQEDTFEALGTVINHQQTILRLQDLKRPHDRAYIEYYKKHQADMPDHLEAQEKAISSSYERRINLQQKFIDELWERTRANDIRLSMLMEERHDLPEIGKLNREALVLIGNFDASQRKWTVAGWLPEFFFTWLEADMKEIASEAQRDLEQRNYKTKSVFISGRSEKTAEQERELMLQELRRKDLRGLVVLAHGTDPKTDKGEAMYAGFYIGRQFKNAEGKELQYGLVPKMAAKCRQGLPPLDILLMHSCNQDYGNRGNEWKNALGLATDGVFKGWNKTVETHEALAWQKEWK